MPRSTRILAGVFLALAISLAPTSAADLLGPTPYRSFADSPFSGLTLTDFQLEDFEDHSLDVPGVTTAQGVIGTGAPWYPSAPLLLDSVDGDDGNPNDGTCTGCDSWFSGPKLGMPVIFQFSADSSGAYPTHVGIVWTDGDPGVPTTFKAYDASGALLGQIGPVVIADGSNYGTTADDRFFGVVDIGGISAISVENSSGGIELDHLQFGHGCAIGVTLLVKAAISISPTSLNVNSQGSSFSIDLDLQNACDPGGPQPINGADLERTWISKAGSFTLQDPLTFPCPDATGSYLFERGISDNVSSRVTRSSGATLRFNQAPDGNCATLDGDRQDLIALLTDVIDGSMAPVCLAGTVSGEPFEACTEVTVRNRGNR